MVDQKKVARYNISFKVDEGYWQIKRVGAEKALKRFSTRKEAIDYGRVIATNQNATVVLYKANGTQETLRRLKKEH